MKKVTWAGLALTMAGAACGNAAAATVSHYEHETAARSCQGALPAFAGTLRARPLAVGNEGASPAFVTCGWAGTDVGDSTSIESVFLTLGNNTAANITVSCTFVQGIANITASGFPTYVTKNTVVAPGTRTFVEFLPADLAGTAVETMQWPQVSCGLPPGGLLYYIGGFYTQEVGA